MSRIPRRSRKKPPAIGAKIVVVCLTLGLTVATPTQAARVTVAVAANFVAALRDLQLGFEEQTGHRVRIVSGSTGKLYAQIANGAPFDVFLAANSHAPQRLEADGLGVAGSRFTYALGALVLWRSMTDGAGPVQAEALRDSRLRRLAMANPKTAPYGRGAEEVLRNLGVYEALRGRIALGENVAQVYQFVATGNAELGFVARSQVLMGPVAGDYWPVPANLYAPIEQQAVLLQRAAENPAAAAFTAFLRAPQTQRKILAYGYQELPQDVP